MSTSLKLTIITPERKLYDGEIKSINTETTEGHIGILPKHAPIIANLKPTVTVIKDNKGEVKRLFTSSGLMKVEEDNIIVLCDASEWKEEIDFNRAEKAKERAENRLKNREEGLDVNRAEIALCRALVRLKFKDLL
ncbi:F0F1 ATP synthase subunit epsilon [Haloimpatiens sp. FM7315]|uniref:F0F1 ATP synthase subunit epsilon n=1 Tax=Haloimpatiens sp. FM7315 TaxID=3298609 RepID=UPI0035A3793F